MAWFEGFSAQRVRVGDHEVFARAGGRVGATALVLLHGFPQTHVM
jgi:haloacetate dehalogenase